MGVVGIVLIVVACLSAVGSVIYGVFRKASRTSWIGWQVFLLFAFTFVLDAVPASKQGSAYFWLVLVFFLLLLGADIGLGEFIRDRVMKHEHPTKREVVFSRIFGAVCALMNIFLLFAVLGGLVFGILAALPSQPAALASFFGSGFWRNFLSRHAYDLFVIAVCFVFIRSGLRLGLIRGIYYLLMLSLTFGCFLSAFLIATKGVPGWGEGLGAKFTTLSPAAGAALGKGLIGFIFFALFFAAVMGLGALLHWGLKKLLDHRPVDLTSNIILCVLFAFVFFAMALAVNYGVAYLAAQTAGGGAIGAAGGVLQRVEALFTSSPFSAALYRCNPFVALLG